MIEKMKGCLAYLPVWQKMESVTLRAMFLIKRNIRATMLANYAQVLFDIEVVLEWRLKLMVNAWFSG